MFKNSMKSEYCQEQQEVSGLQILKNQNQVYLKTPGKTNYTLTQITDEESESIIDIFNHYVVNSYAAYPETRLPYEAFDKFLQMFQGFPNAVVKDKNDKLVGFGFLRTYNHIPNFCTYSGNNVFSEPSLYR